MTSEKKCVLITGASGNIGLATTRKFLQKDWSVIGTYLNQQNKFESVKDDSAFRNISVDLGNINSINKLFEDLNSENINKL